MLKEIQSLKQKKYRDAAGLFFIEGEKFIEEIPKNWEIAYLVCSESWWRENPGFICRGSLQPIKDSLFAQISDTKTPQGILAVCRKKIHNPAELLKKEKALIILAEEMNDPGNLGTIIRTAHASGADGVFLSGGSVDVYNPKVLRASAGSFFHIPVIQDIKLPEIIPQLKKNNIKIIAANMESNIYPYDIDFTESTALLIGNEARGLSNESLDLTDCKVKIPMPGGAESLNVSVACAVLLYEAVRQRIIMP